MDLQQTILEVTYTDPKVKYAIDSQIGKAYTMFQKLHFGQIGSQGFEIIEYSSNFAMFFEQNEDTHKANMELRPGGILIGFQQGYRSYKWIISFGSLNLSIQAKIVLIMSGVAFLKVRPLHRAKLDTSFIDKVNRQKESNI